MRRLLVRGKGLEPPRLYSHTDLNRARLPVPPPSRDSGRKLVSLRRNVKHRWPVVVRHSHSQRSLLAAHASVHSQIQCSLLGLLKPGERHLALISADPSFQSRVAEPAERTRVLPWASRTNHTIPELPHPLRATPPPDHEAITPRHCIWANTRTRSKAALDSSSSRPCSRPAGERAGASPRETS